MKKPGFDMDFAVKVTKEKDARQRSKIRALNLPKQVQKDMLGGLNTFFDMIIVVGGGCIKLDHQPMLLRFVMGRLDDLIALERRPGGAITASVDEIQKLCEIRARAQTDEIRREHLTRRDASDITLITQVLLNQILTMTRTLPSRETVLVLAREQITDFLVIFGSSPRGSRISTLSPLMN